ncbi:MAG: type 1 glutamine amidotransferase [Actinomycetota bacterium]|nr:type 1 glutamine amidotransferase [Actinomycetota bacterium]
MRALIIEHDHLSPAGPIGQALLEHGYQVVEFVVVPGARFESPGISADFPELAEFDLLVSMGAPWSVYDRSRIEPWLSQETALLMAADATGVPVLGICFGGQLLAQAHGGSVCRSPKPEIGWYPMAADDAELIGQGPWFEWHFDHWTLPPGATEIARNELASQAFWLRRNLAVQFHPELTADTLRGWLTNGGDRSAIAHGVDPDRLIEQTLHNEGDASERAHRLITRFLSQVGVS